MKNINEKKLQKIAVLTSGGDAPGMNAAVRAVVLAGAKKGFKVYGVKDGYLGLYNNKIELLDEHSLPRIINLAGTFLGTARFIPFKEDENVRKQCVRNLKNLGIEKLIVIGGDGSYQGALKLSNLGLQCVGIPATIDNDMHFTDFSIGFSTALNNIREAIEKLRDTSISHNRCSIIEVMGRHKGDLALYGGIATGADLIITRENPIEKQFIFEKVKSLYEANQRSVIIVVTEHILDIHILAKELEAYSGFETRAQILGHIQRGGTPTAEDLVLASRMSYYAVELLTKDVHKCGIIISGLDLNYVDFETILYNPNNRDLLEKFKNII